MEASSTLGVVLAGGASERMGAAKATLELDGRPLIERPLAALTAAGLDRVVVAKADTALPPLGADRWDEPDEPRHPLRGIVTALERAGRPVVVLACDMPSVPPALVRRLARTPGRAVVPAPGGRLEPLAARYEPAALPILRLALERGASLRDAVAALGPEALGDAELAALGDPAAMFANVNRPDDLARARGGPV